MKEYKKEMLRRAKPWGIGFFISFVCLWLTLEITGFYETYKMSYVSVLMLVIVIFFAIVLGVHLILMYIPIISTLLGRKFGSISRKFGQFSARNIEKTKEYYRKILKGNSPLILGFLDNMEIEKKDLIAELLCLNLNDIIRFENEKIIVNNFNSNFLIKNYEKTFLENLKNGKLQLNNSYLISLRNSISSILLNDSLIKKKKSRGENKYRHLEIKNNKVMKYLLGIVGIIFGIICVLSTFNEYIKEIFATIMLAVVFIPIILIFILLPFRNEYRKNKGSIYKRTYEGKMLTKKLEGLKNYLKDYSLMDEREAKEIELWDDYLIYSVMFGQNKKVIEEYEKYIEIVED